MQNAVSYEKYNFGDVGGLLYCFTFNYLGYLRDDSRKKYKINKNLTLYGNLLTIAVLDFCRDNYEIIVLIKRTKSAFTNLLLLLIFLYSLYPCALLRNFVIEVNACSPFSFYAVCLCILFETIQFRLKLYSIFFILRLA